MKGACSSSARTHFLAEGTTKGNSKTSVIYRLSGLILGTLVPCITFFKRKGERFSPLRRPWQQIQRQHLQNHRYLSLLSAATGKISDCKGLDKVCSQVRPTFWPDNTRRAKLNIFYCTAGAGWKGRAVQNAYPMLQHGNGSWETEKLFKIASWFIRNNSKVDTSPTFHPTHRFITDTREMLWRTKFLPPPFFPTKLLAGFYL